jgi:hypothetical protein
LSLTLAEVFFERYDKLKPYRTLIPARAPQIATKVANIFPTIDTVASDITSVGTNIMCFGPDFPPISSQFFLGRAIPFIQSKFTDVTTTVDQIRPHVASIRSCVPGVGANLSAVRAQFTSFPPIDISATTILRQRSYCRNTNQRE